MKRIREEEGGEKIRRRRSEGIRGGRKRGGEDEGKRRGREERKEREKRKKREEQEEWMENLSTPYSGGVVGWGEREV